MSAAPDSDSASVPTAHKGPLEVCPLCGGGNHELLYPATIRADEPLSSEEFTCTNIHFGRHLAIYKCPGCGLVYSEEEENPNEILLSYEDVEDETYLQESEGRVRTFRRHLKDMTPYLPRGRKLLDIGAYVGVFLKVALEEGFDAQGVEPSKWARQQDPALKDKYAGATLDDILPAQAGTYDVVTLWDVIEHLTDPFSLVKQVHEVLAPGGLFALSTHNIESKWARLYGSKYPFLMRMHIFHFSHRTIRRMLEDEGFEVVALFKHRRFLSVGYFLDRLGSLFPPLAGVLRIPAKLFGLERVYIPMFSFGLMNVFARKKG